MPVLFGILICLLVVAITSLDFFRRRFYKWFHRIHHLNWIFLLLSVTHSWTLWNYFFIGSVLYIVDKIVRLHKSIHPFKVASIHPTEDGGHTCLVMTPLHDEFQFSAGQFGWINIPAIDPISWHPFSMVPMKDEIGVRFVIKSNGPNTWTGNLLSLSPASTLTLTESSTDFGSINSTETEGKSLLEKSQDSPIEVHLDGPYGQLSINPSNYGRIVLIAGGVGITPMASIFFDIAIRRPMKMVTCTLYWTVRSPEIFSVFEKEFSEICSANPNSMKVIYIATQSKGQVMIGENEIRKERLNVLDELTRYSVDRRDLGVFVCGPQVLVESTVTACRSIDCDVHTEIFEF